MPSIQLVVSTVSAVWSHTDLGDDEALVLLDVAAELRDRRAFEPQVELEQRRALERRDDIDRPQPPDFRRDAFEQARGGVVALEIGEEPLPDPRPQDLDRHRLRACRRATSTALCTCAIEAAAIGGESSVSSAARSPSACAEQRGHQRRIERLHLVLQHREILRDLGADDVGPRRQRLAELHVGRPEPVERPRQPLDPARSA